MASAAVVSTLAIAAPITTASASSPGPTTVGGLTPGAIKHVWLIILENKSYDETFTGLNNNSYLWQTLPSEGVLLKNYYGTGHTSMDNYIALASGQAPAGGHPERLQHRQLAVQLNSTIITTGRSVRHARTGTTARPSRCSGPTPRPVHLRTPPTAAPTRRRSRLSSTSSTPPA